MIERALFKVILANSRLSEVYIVAPDMIKALKLVKSEYHSEWEVQSIENISNNVLLYHEYYNDKK